MTNNEKILMKWLSRANRRAISAEAIARSLRAALVAHGVVGADEVNGFVAGHLEFAKEELALLDLIDSTPLLDVPEVPPRLQ